MQQARILDTRPEIDTLGVTANTTLSATDVEDWLQAQPSHPAVWRPRGIGNFGVNNEEELARHVGRLRSEGSWGVAQRLRADDWAQCMRVVGGWIVEVNGIPGPEGFARRVQRRGESVGGARRRVRDAGRVMAVYRPRDVIPTAAAAAEIMWSWLRGGLPSGYDLRDI